MKTIVIFVLLLFFASFSSVIAQTENWENFELIDRLLTLPGPGAPIIHENSIIFTADSNLRRVGVAFAHENFANVYWFRQLLVSQDHMNPVLHHDSRIPGDLRDSGIQFFVYQIPQHIRELEYRLVVNGLWTTDPLNPQTRRDLASGLSFSVLHLPQRPSRPNPASGLPEGLRFSFRGPPGEVVTVAGCFNNWDPFMFELREGPAGYYSLLIPLPPGTYQYLFFHRGQRLTDPYNPNRIFARDGRAASVIVVP